MEPLADLKQAGEHVNPYRIYLRGELAKLRHPGDVADFLDKGACSLEELGLRVSSREITRSFDTQDQVDRFVESLSDDEAVQLTDCCGRWRGNGIATTLSLLPRAEIVPVDVAKVLLREAESWLVPILRRHGFSLPAVAMDPELLSRDPYRSRSAREDVEFPICIAVGVPDTSGRVRLIDGVHRAIQLVRNGQTHLNLCLLRK